MNKKLKIAKHLRSDSISSCLSGEEEYLAQIQVLRDNGLSDYEIESGYPEDITSDPQYSEQEDQFSYYDEQRYEEDRNFTAEEGDLW